MNSIPLPKAKPFREIVICAILLWHKEHPEAWKEPCRAIHSNSGIPLILMKHGELSYAPHAIRSFIKAIKGVSSLIIFMGKGILTGYPFSLEYHLHFIPKPVSKMRSSSSQKIPCFVRHKKNNYRVNFIFAQKSIANIAIY
jgi:hypothetical protein